MVAGNYFVCFIIALIFLRLQELAESKVPQLPQEEVEALKEVMYAMGTVVWNFNADTCRIEMVGLTEAPPKGSERRIDCECHFKNNTECRVVKLMIKGYSLPGLLPTELVKLPYLREIDFAYNYLRGTIPKEWASMKLTYLSVFVNRVSGEIPKELGNIKTLTYLDLGANNFSGTLPYELGYLVNLRILVLCSNRLTGNLPETFAGLKNLADIRLSDNSFNGTMPEWLQNWKQLERLVLSQLIIYHSWVAMLLRTTNCDNKGGSNFPVLLPVDYTSWVAKSANWEVQFYCYITHGTSSC